MPIAISDSAKPRVLFYLPVVTPWWFTKLIVPMIRAANRGGEVHVLVPPFWSCTGVRPEDLADCGDLDDVNWHILDRGDHPDLRLTGKVHDHVLELVREIDPDLCLCRSADIDTPAQFPGVVRYIMEADPQPLGTPYWTVQLTKGLFDHALMPDVIPAQAEWLEAAVAKRFAGKKADFTSMGREQFLAEAGLPSDKLLIAMPLELEHDEIFWDQHNPFPDNVALIDALADALDDDAMLMVTTHPLADKQLSTALLKFKQTIRRHRDKVRIVPPVGGPGTATRLMLQHCDGTIFGNSKSFSSAALLGKPMMRMSKFATGDWLNTYSTLQAFTEALRAGKARAPSEADTRRWFAFHHANNIIAPTDPELDVARLIDHAVNPVNPARWERGLARYLGDDAHLLPTMPTSETLEYCHV